MQDWVRWANTKERRLIFGFNYEPSERDVAMHNEAGIPVQPVVEGVTMKPDWYKEIVEKQIKKILEAP